jgi:hypothetical protein
MSSSSGKRKDRMKLSLPSKLVEKFSLHFRVLFDLIWRQKEFGLNFFILVSTTLPNNKLGLRAFEFREGKALVSNLGLGALW